MSQFYYTINIENSKLILQLNGLDILVLKTWPAFFSAGYSIKNVLTGEKFILKVFRRSIIYYKEEKIELYNDQNENILRIFFSSDRKSLSTAKGNFFHNDLQTNLLERDKRQLTFTDDPNNEMNGNYERTFFTSIFNYEFAAPMEITNVFFLCIFCFSHQALLRPAKF